MLKQPKRQPLLRRLLRALGDSMTKTFANIGVWLCALAMAACSGDPGQPVSYGAAHDADMTKSADIGMIAAHADADADAAIEIAPPDVGSSCTEAQHAACYDGNECTMDGCFPQNGGCYHPAINGSCDDGNACTSADACFGGKCQGTPMSCDDAKPCTLDSCSGGVCKHVDQCDDGLDCTVDACTAGGCTHGDTCMGAFACSADNGTCQPVAGCNGAISAAYLALVDQYKDSVGSFPNLQTKCTFKNDCLAKIGASEQQACIAKCLTQETPLDATCAACYGAYDGCIAKNCAALCNGTWLSADCAACQATHCDTALKACADLPPSKCQLPSVWSPNLQVISKLALAEPGVGCDLNGDGKPDNVLGKFNSLYTGENAALQTAISQGKLLTVWNAPLFATNGDEFSIERLDAVLDAGNANCDVAAGGKPCVVRVKAANYGASSSGGTCVAKNQLKPASIIGGAFSVPGGGGSIPISLLDLMAIQVNAGVDAWTGTIVGGAQWQTTTGGMHCGAVTKTALLAGIDMLPTSVLAQIGDAATVKALIAGIVKPDLDLDGDGIKESISFAMAFETVPVVVTGISP